MRRLLKDADACAVFACRCYAGSAYLVICGMALAVMKVTSLLLPLVLV